MADSLLFTSSMIRAILDGTKTQTRRVVSSRNCVAGSGPSPRLDHLDLNAGWADGDPNEEKTRGRYMKAPYSGDTVPMLEGTVHRIWPRIETNTSLWVREGFAFPRGLDPADPKRDLDRMSPTEIGKMAIDAGYDRPWCPSRYRADLGVRGEYDETFWGQWGRWRPSIHMPRWASRLELDVVRVQVERLNTIQWNEIRSEGVRCPAHDFDGGFCHGECPNLRHAWKRLWDGINASRGAPYDSNPWVLAIEFRRRLR